LKKEYAIHNHAAYFVSNNGTTKKVDPRHVEVLARAQGYAMVRRKGCAPYIASEKDLLPLPKETQ